MGLPPGPVHLARLFPIFAIPSTVAYVILRVLRDYYYLPIPRWLLIIVTILAKPILFILNGVYVEHRNKQKARELGAVMAPRVHEEWPRFGGVSLVTKVVKMITHGYVADVYLDWAQDYGWVYELKYPTDLQIYTSEPEHLKAILSQQFEDFDKGPVLDSQIRPFLGLGVFNSDGELWKFHRTLTRPFFTRNRLSDFQNFDQHASVVLKLAKERLAEGHAIDFQDLAGRFTLDSSTQFLFGSDFKSLEAGIPYAKSTGIENPPSFTDHPSNTFLHAFESGVHRTALRARMGSEWPWTEMFADKVKPVRTALDHYLEPLILNALEEKRLRGEKVEKAPDSAAEGDTLMAHLIEQTQDTQIIKDEILNLLVAGRDTTATTLTFAFYMLAEHPHIVHRLQEEIFTALGPTKRPTIDEMRDMRYLRAFINEVLRLYPPIPLNIRMSNKDCTWPSKNGPPIFVPKDSIIMYGTMLMQRRTDLWGPDALEFDPDRFLDERVHKYLTPNPFIFVPFSAGPRICIGQQFAYHEVAFFLIRLIQEFTDFALALDAQPPETLPPKEWKQSGGLKAQSKLSPSVHVTLFMRGGLWVRMKERKKSEI